jgi:hypothetical protein
MVENRFPAELLWIMEGGWVSVKFGAAGLCPKCNRRQELATEARKAQRNEGKKPIPRVHALGRTSWFLQASGGPRIWCSEEA